MLQKFSPEKRSIWQECRRICKAASKVAMEFWSALLQIRDDKLYLEEYETFEEFCEKDLGIGKTHAYRILLAQKVKESLPPQLADKITNEAQARALADVPEKDRAKVIKKASKDGPITPAKINEAAAQMSPRGDTNGPSGHCSSEKKPEKPTIELDKQGWAIPAKALPFWERSQEVQNMLTTLSKIKGTLEKAASSKDPMFQEMNFSNTLSKLSDAWIDLKRALPYAVCTMCQGHFASPCTFCNNRGLISEFAWTHQANKEIINIRAKGAKK